MLSQCAVSLSISALAARSLIDSGPIADLLEARRRTTMRYMLLLYLDEKLNDMSPEAMSK